MHPEFGLSTALLGVAFTAHTRNATALSVVSGGPLPSSPSSSRRVTSEPHVCDMDDQAGGHGCS